MKVLKFGGTSVGSVENLQRVKHIVEKVEKPAVVVVSAVGGITDKLINTAKIAARGTNEYINHYQEIVKIHQELINDVLSADEIKEIQHQIDTLHNELANLYKGVSLIKDLSKKTEDTIVSYGERISSLFISKMIAAKLLDSREFIKTEVSFGKHIVNFDLTNKLIEDKFAKHSELSIVPGFISTDVKTDEITNLGRGGSDYTAALIASALNADALEIWTDVDGFMTADPKVISKAYVIDKLSYVEAMELSNFGAKVIYSPTIYPVCQKNIPIYIKNTLNPELAGTLISNAKDAETKPIKGISSIPNTSLITMQGMGMIGIESTNGRTFSILSQNGINVFFISQASSGSSISFGVRREEAGLAMELLKKEFAKEIRHGEINSITVETDLATVAIVGENMKQSTGTAGKLFNSLGRNNINIIALAQGSSETNISFVVRATNLRKALNSIHESFFLSEYQELNLFVVGTGTVGGSLLQQFHTQNELLMKQNSLKVKVIGIANEYGYLIDRNGIDLTSYDERIKKEGLPSTPETLKQAIFDLNIYNCVFVDCTASAAIASMYKDLLSHNVSVVAANKIAASSEYSKYIELKNIARQRGVKYLFETNVGAGLPIINTINDLVYSGDKILKLEAVLSGTLNFIFNAISKDMPLSKAIRGAMEARFAEPDPRIDLSGKDVIRKLVILARESGYVVEEEDVEKNLFIPKDFFEGSLDDFWAKVEKFDAEFEKKRKVLEEKNMRWRFIAKLDNGKTSVGLEAVDSHHPFYDLEGSNNLIIITTERYKQYPMMIRGYGAGAEVTAAGVFADIISIANIR
jgi:aspartokinase/homoserine dehydrogenase 1